MILSKKKIILCLFFILIYADLFAAENVTIVYTNSLNGWLDSCKCKEEPKGGLVKRATELKKIRGEYKNVLLFETGDFFSYDQSEAALAKYIVQAYKQINYDGVLFGDQEFRIGINNFLNLKNSIPFVCNNILINNGTGFKNYFKRYVMIKKSSLKIGVIGTMGKDAFKYYPNEIVTNIKILNQIQEINKDIKTLKKMGADIIILLSHSGYESDKELSKQIKGIDVIIGGHSQTLVEKPYYDGKTIVVQAGADGAHIGILTLIINKGKIDKYSNSFRRPTDTSPEDDANIRKLINEYQNDLKKKYKKLRFD